MMSVFSDNKLCFADYLGIIPYEDALKLQQALVEARVDGKVSDALLLLQHPPVFTIGRFRGKEDIIVPDELLARREIEVFTTNRGGSITHHGPGQLVGYPILDLKENGIGVREYIWKLEEVIIELLLGFGLEGYRVARYPGGVWADEKKVCSIGIHVSHHITMHGFALNVNNDLSYFDYINPCGIKGDNVMTSISELQGNQIEVETITENILNSFSKTFGLRCERGLDKCLSIIDGLNG